MTTTDHLPEFEACIRLYRRVYREHGSEPFTGDQIEADAFETDVSRLLDLSVAYGVIEFDGHSYRASVAPDATTERWRSALGTHSDRIRQAIEDVEPETHDTGEPADELAHEGKRFGSVFVSKGDGFESVVDSIANVPSVERDGIVLRSAGEYANELQRLADRICATSGADGALEGDFQKEASDVVGRNKDELEFRLFLAYA